MEDEPRAGRDNERQLERRARRRVGMKVGLGIHALVYVLVNLGLLALNAWTGGERWAIYPLFGWGLGLAIHGIVTFVSLRSDGWKGRMLEQEIERLRRQR